MADLPSELVDLADAAAILGIDDATARSWMDLRTLRGTKGPDGEYFFRRVDIEDMAAPLVRAEDAPVPSLALGPQVVSPSEQMAFVTGKLKSNRFAVESRSRPLFHYTPAATALDYILRDASLRLSPPSRMNDPFESDPHLVNLRGDLGDDRPDAVQMIEDASQLLRERCRLTCLALSGPNEWSSLIGYGDGYTRARMWTQYADGHRGVCLAFDQNRLREAVRATAEKKGLKLYEAPIRYLARDERSILIELPAERALKDLARLIDDIFPGVVAGLYFSKAWDWSTESEYRFLLHGDAAEDEYVDISRTLTGVFCGASFPERRLDDLRACCPQLHDDNRIYRMFWRNGFPIAMPANHGSSSSGRAYPAWDVPPRPVDPQSG
jgi:Protein of unknown function (DUF2971)